MKNGSRPSDRIVSRQSISHIAMTVLIAMAKLDVTELAVSVTTDWTPPTSLASRLWISPVRVSVKNRSGIAWRCAYSAERRSCITRWPIRLLRYDCPTPIRPETIGRTIIRHDEQVQQQRGPAAGSRRR